MTRKPSCHMIDMLAEVPDPRKNKGKRHPSQYEKAHGRLETRCIKASTSLNAYLDWSGIEQVIHAIGQKAEHRRRNKQSPLW